MTMLHFSILLLAGLQMQVDQPEPESQRPPVEEDGGNFSLFLGFLAFEPLLFTSPGQAEVGEILPAGVPGDTRDFIHSIYGPPVFVSQDYPYPESSPPQEVMGGDPYWAVPQDEFVSYVQPIPRFCGVGISMHGDANGDYIAGIPRRARDADGFSFLQIADWVPVWFPSEIPFWVVSRGPTEDIRWAHHWREVRGYWLEQAQRSLGLVKFHDLNKVFIHISLWKELRGDRHLLIWSEEAFLLNGYMP